MNFNAVIDTAAFIWNEDLYSKDQTLFYKLASDLIIFVEVFEKESPTIFLRNDLLIEMRNSFPWDLTANKPYFKEFKTIVYAFLSKLPDNIIEFDGNILDGLVSGPNIIYSYYNKEVEQEIAFLISEIHSNSTQTLYFTFSPIWEEKRQLTTKIKEQSRVHQTIIYPDDDLFAVFASFKPIFEHNSKHDKSKGPRTENGEIISPLTCFDNLIHPPNNSIPQGILDKAMKESGLSHKLFGYDEVNETFVCFQSHDKNKYHGYDVDTSNVPHPIQKHFGKYYG
jgi:hypothetical protein